MRCEIRVKGQLDSSWSAWFDGLAITAAADGQTVLSGHLPDQAALHGALMKVRDLGLVLLAVNQVPDNASAAHGAAPDGL